MQFVQSLLDILFPPRCAGCHASGHILCSTCFLQIQLPPPPFCQHCGLPLVADDICKHCQYNPLALSALRMGSAYREPLRTCIHALKYEGHTRLAEPLGRFLAYACMTYGIRADLIIPVPLHIERYRQRGYNQAQLLAQVCAAYTGIPLRNDILIRYRPTNAQVGLTASERRQNVAGAFLCTPAFASGTLCGYTILLIDDVCTTGATLEACATPLFAAGAAAVWGLVLARPVI